MQKKLGNPNLVKGGPSLNPNGRPKGSKNVASILKVATVLSAENIHPVLRLINLAESAERAGDRQLASDIWEGLLKYCEPQKKPVEVAPEKPTTPEESKQAADAAMAYLKELENGTSGTNPGAETSNPISLDNGTPAISSEAGPAQDVRLDQDKQGIDLRPELLPPFGEELHDRSDSSRNSDTDA